MRSLFLRIFLWFWLAMAVVAAVLVVSSPLLTRSRPAVERWQRSAEEVLLRRAREAAEVIATDGLAPYLADGGRRTHDHRLRIFVFATSGEQVAGEPAPPDERAIAAGGGESFERRGALYLATVPAADPRGQHYQVVVGYRRPPSLIDLLEPHILAPRLLALLLVAGALCFWLARYLTSPVALLRQATRRLSGGDLTARVGGAIARRRDELGDLARDFDSMAARLEGLVASQRRLVSDVSHELRSPLARLSVALELARQQAGDDASRSLDRIGREAERLNELVGQLLLLSRLEGSGQEEDVVDFDVRELLADVVEDAAFEARSRGCSVELEAGAPLLLAGSPALVRSAVENVVRNAMRYTEPATVVEVSAGGDSTDGDVFVRVRDHGPGVPEEALDALFEPFFRVDDARDRETGGTGLGLAIARRAVAAHGGRISARNVAPHGLEVSIQLPRRGGSGDVHHAQA